jgi:ABC-type branched-subunit amino acid transport system permease subunit
MSLWYSAHLTLIQATLVYTLLALSLQVVLRSGVFSLAGIGFFGLGGYTAGILAKHGQSAPVAILVPLVGGIVFGYLLSLPLVRLRGLYLGLVTVGFDLILNVFATNGGKLTGGAVGLFGIPLLVNTPVILTIVVVAIVLVSQLERRNMGRGFEALRLNEDLARSLGLEVTRQRNFAFALSAALGAVAGALQVLFFTSINPGTAGFELIVLGLTMAVLGGVGTWLGAAVGAVIVTWLPEFLGSSVGQWRNLVYGAVVVIIAVYAPDGIVGLVKRGAHFVRAQLGGKTPEALEEAAAEVPPATAVIPAGVASTPASGSAS